MYDFILIAGPCRSGTTFVFNALANADYVGMFQPLKHLIRCNYSGINSELQMLPHGERIVVKEAFGPYIEEEVSYDPIFIITEEFKPSKPLILLVLRSPSKCYMSWKKSFFHNKEINNDVFNMAYVNTLNLYNNYVNRIEIKVLLIDEERSFNKNLSTIKSEICTAEVDNYRRFVKMKDPTEFEVHGLLDKALSGKVYREDFLSNSCPEFDTSAIHRSYVCYDFLRSVPEVNGVFA
ncbi:hypothetical protein A584_29006 [Pseudomonas syringae pv. theae ICMP 3923]|uniref:sulfotransferase family protein n=1 Tax=Pseudomonas syringae TaxID=317 RepID=UPI000357B72F|nr:sulfotransferase family protein [Pseudomonas syringae]EPM65029.1 hypothetical protein A584_29006 [Pseudomonas syringae pv. theae ICMP 3923]KPZ29968.1 hypothetical protein AN901_200824 [Pseudomonas syringae pv. theae]MBL3874615.1 sulfotransferase family protein [Pseudomonas syringae pv. theae]GKQ30687.1 hypothetical protein PSTH68_14230 [Pseudomonas syringae pv. theae]